MLAWFRVVTSMIKSSHFCVVLIGFAPIICMFVTIAFGLLRKPPKNSNLGLNILSCF